MFNDKSRVSRQIWPGLIACLSTDERSEFDSVEPWPGKGYVAFEGRYEERGATHRTAISIGPEYDTVGYEFAWAAARKARDALDILIIYGFQFEPEIDDPMLHFGRLKVLRARMNQDIRMGDKLKISALGTFSRSLANLTLKCMMPVTG